MIDMQVLLLNNSEEVLNIIPWHRAVRLIHTGKASAPVGHDDYYRIPTGEGYFDLPTAIILVKYVNVPYSNARLSKKNIMKRDEHKCQYCNTQLNAKNQTLDHIVPISRGGKDTWTNLVACCKPCNARKANKTPEEAKMKLLSKPAVPTRRVLAIKYISKQSHRKWERWIY